MSLFVTVREKAATFTEKEKPKSWMNFSLLWCLLF